MTLQQQPCNFCMRIKTVDAIETYPHPNGCVFNKCSEFSRCGGLFKRALLQQAIILLSVWCVGLRSQGVDHVVVDI